MSRASNNLISTRYWRDLDYFDLSVLFEREALDTDLLAKAIQATFERRGLALPSIPPIGLSSEFGTDASRQSLWLAFLRKNNLPIEPLGGVVDRLQAALLPALTAANLLRARTAHGADRSG